MNLLDLLLSQDFSEQTKLKVGVLLAVSVILTSWLIKNLYKKQKKQAVELVAALALIEKNISYNRTLATADYSKVKEILQAFRGEMHLLKIGVDPLKGCLFSLEGQLKNQNDTLMKYVEKMGVVSGKLDAVFRFIDAQPRNSDQANKQA